MAIQRDVGAVTSYAEAVAGGYTGTRAQWRNLLANLPKEPFIATFNTTAYADVLAAYEDGRAVFATMDGRSAPLSYVDSNDEFYFFAANGGYGDTAVGPIKLRLKANGQWSVISPIYYPGDQVTVSVSGLTSTNVEDALAELAVETPSDASDLLYDNSSSGLTSDNVQGAIDELKEVVESGGMLVIGTATYDASDNFTGITITSGQTKGEIYIAARSGPGVYLMLSNKIYTLVSRPSGTTGSAIFARTDGEETRLYDLYASWHAPNPVTYTWFETVVNLQNTANLVTSLSDSSTDTEYPSAKCVYDELAAIKERLTAVEQH